jgi:DHA1 family 2-module integral membrane pump EmrD-like MFS transporter
VTTKRRTHAALTRSEPSRVVGIRLSNVAMNHTIPERATTSSREPNSPRFLLLLICLFASAGQLAIDIYVPALPAMARFFATSPQAIQSSVSSYMAAYALGQLIFGPVADAHGRKPVLAFGLVVFTIGCVL